MSSTPAAGAAAATGTVASAVFRVQMALLDGAAASNEPLLHAAASALLSRADYDDVVTERTIADACGNPACPNPLPAASAAGGPRFHISLREHRVYDLEEARKFCSDRCLVASAALAASLPHDRPFGVPPERLDAVVALVEGGGAGVGDVLGFRGAGGKVEDEGRKVEIKEKELAGAGEVTLQDWIGPSDAIEGYVPRRDRTADGQKPEAKPKKVSGPEQPRTENVDSRNVAPGEDGITSSSSLVETLVSAEVIAERMSNMVLSENTKPPRKKKTKIPSKVLEQEEENSMLSSCISDSIAKQLEDTVLEEKKVSKKKKASKTTSMTQKSKSRARSAGLDGHEMDFTSTIIIGDASTNMEQRTMDKYNYLSSSLLAENHPSPSQSINSSSTQSYAEQLYKEFSKAVNIGKDETSDEKMGPALKSSLKIDRSKSSTQSVRWADENGSVLETSKAYESPSTSIKQSEEGIDSSLRCASAEACAAALVEAAEAISSGTSEVEDAVSKAGIIILPDTLHQKEYDNAKDTGGDDHEIDRDVVKWPKKPVLLDTDMFEVDDSWHDTPPEGFSLTLSAFGTMWATLFGWISRSSLAYVYGLDGGSVEELLIANGREYPEKIVLKDGHSSEIRRALDSCVCNAVPVLISNLRLQIPVSKLEITLGYLIDTMSFVEALPSLRSRQWQVMVLVLLDALSVHQLPGIAPAISNAKLVQKFLNAAQVSREEYDSMVELCLPFGRSIQACTPIQLKQEAV